MARQKAGEARVVLSHTLEAEAWPGKAGGGERHGRCWRDYENPYPVRGWSGDGPRRRGDELPRRSAATLVAAALRSRGPKIDCGNGFREAVVGGEHGLQQAPALRRDCRGGAGIVTGSQGRSVSPCRFVRRLWQGAAAPGWRGARRGRLCQAQHRRCRRESEGFADGGSGIGFAQGGGRGGRLRRSGLVGIGQRATVLDWPRRLRWSEPGRGRESAGTASALCSLGTAGFAGRGWRSVASRRCSGRERERGRARERQLQQGRIYSVSIGVRRHR
uniref:Uncharacterized protein n=1 Tax=Oryza sativa subsp. japonica TaxID=39947 RepID=Q6ZG70_ORYSJ|nr:hypothetical protein [Oryza sativa Japonica Group]